MLHQVAANYNVADEFAKAFQAPGRAIVGAAELATVARCLGGIGLSALGDPALGVPVRTSRSSWVRRVQVAANDLFIKTYVYTTLADQRRGALRFTGPHCASRAQCEARALAWLAAHGFAAADVIGVVENRAWGFVRGAVLVLRAWEGLNLETLIPQLEAPAALELAADLGRFVTALHRSGFRDRNLDLRNLLARRHQGEPEPAGGGALAASRWLLTKIDSPRHRLVRPGRTDDRLARADWRRLLPQLRAHGLDATALDAARRA